MGIRKLYVKNKDVCKVTFSFPFDGAVTVKSACVVGDFNNWEIGATPMKKSKDGQFVATVNLACGSEYQFRYLLNESIWENDWNADRYVASPHGGAENSVVVV